MTKKSSNMDTKSLTAAVANYNPTSTRASSVPPARNVIVEWPLDRAWARPVVDSMDKTDGLLDDQ